MDNQVQKALGPWKGHDHNWSSKYNIILKMPTKNAEWKLQEKSAKLLIKSIRITADSKVQQTMKYFKSWKKITSNKDYYV
jgi:hypothetical protein